MHGWKTKNNNFSSKETALEKYWNNCIKEAKLKSDIMANIYLL